jgi:outer membrane protein insertion porin family
MIPRRSRKYIIPLLLVISVSTYSQTINRIEVAGNSEFSKSSYLEWAKVSAGSLFSANLTDSINSRISTELSKIGYLQNEVNITSTAVDTNTIDLTIEIRENDPTYINSIIFLNPDSVYTDYLSGKYKFLEGKIFNKYELETLFAETLDYFENKGNPFASIYVNSVYFYCDSTESAHLADIYLSVKGEAASRINRFNLLGNTKTEDYVIMRNTRIKIGDEYSQDKIDQVPRLLNRLRFFEPVSAPKYYFNSKNEGILEITVQEKVTNSFDGIVGYVPSNIKGENGFFTGFINISLRNLFGTERAAAFRWQKEDRESQELDIKYFEPWAFNYPFNIQLGIFQRLQDTTYVQRRIEGTIEFLATDEISASFLVANESTIPTDPDNRGFTVFNSTSLTTGANFKIDTRDDTYAPTEGLLFINTYKYSSKKINGPEQYVSSSTKTKTGLQRFELDINYYYEILSRQVINAGIHGKELRGDLIETSDLYKLGGTNSLRGYVENQFLGNRIFWSNLEYRYLIERRSFLFGFFDAGYYLRSADNSKLIEKLEAFKIGYGLGLSIETGLGVMAVSYALGLGDSFSEGKIHFGLLNEF